MNSYITSIGTANPEYKFDQMEICQFMANAAEMDEKERRKLEFLYKQSGIKSRYSAIPDFNGKKSSFQFFSNLKSDSPSTSVRMELYKKKALPLALLAVKNCLSDNEHKKPAITHIITVSCTGMYAPGLDIDIIQSLGLKTSVQRYCVNYMGCYAAFNAIKLADMICRSDKRAKVLIVGVELCTIHFQNRKETDHILSNALFSDGAGAMLVEAFPSEKYSLALRANHCEIAAQGMNEMAWNIADHGFEMVLSQKVPDLIKGEIKSMVGKLLNKTGVKYPNIDFFAIHPGGRKILEAVETELEIDPTKMKESYEVLQDYGNMSSVTMIFIFEKILNNVNDVNIGNMILSMAFGPGLTLESLLLKVVGVNKKQLTYSNHPENLKILFE